MHYFRASVAFRTIFLATIVLCVPVRVSFADSETDVQTLIASGSYAEAETCCEHVLLTHMSLSRANRPFS